MKKFLKRLLMVFIVLGSASISSSVSLKKFTGLKPTPLFIDFMGRFSINGTDGKTGCEIGVFTKEGVPCGAFKVTIPGQYGVLHVYGDDPTTPEKEGAVPGDELVFIVWDNEHGSEYTVSLDEMIPFSVGSVAPSPIPPVWTGDKDRYGLQLKVRNRNSGVKVQEKYKPKASSRAGAETPHKLR